MGPLLSSLSHSLKTLPLETHPLQPFLPEGATLLMLGSFPPARHRWSMDFFYPNYINDMWRVFGLILHGDKNHFVDEAHRTFRLDAIREMLTQRGIAPYDTATVVRRLKNTASDKDLEVVQATDLTALIGRLPCLRAIAATGEKACQLAAAHFGIAPPRVGAYTEFQHCGRTLRLYRMPSTSRAYPLSLEKKAACYRNLLLAF